jgi:cytidyltransferase-like protein
MSIVFRSLEEATGRFGPCALTIGNFDGVHIGHQQLLREAREQAQVRGCRSGVLTFHPHPRTVVAPHRTAKLLASIDERLALLEKTVVDHILVLPYTPELANLSAELCRRSAAVAKRFRARSFASTSSKARLHARVDYSVAVTV